MTSLYPPLPSRASDGDDLEALALAFCARHAISDPAAAARDLVRQMTELVDAQPPRRLFAASIPPSSSSASPSSVPLVSSFSSSSSSSSRLAPLPLPGGGDSDTGNDGTSFTARVAAFYGAWEPRKLDDPSFVPGVVAKYGTNRDWIEVLHWRPSMCARCYCTECYTGWRGLVRF